MNSKQPIFNTNGITVRQLKEFINDLEETDDNGGDFTLWSESMAGPTPITELWTLNLGDLMFSVGFQSLYKTPASDSLV